MTDRQENVKNDKIDATKRLVDNLFKAVSENDEIPSSIRLTLSLLQPYYLALAIESPNLFAIENHQARIFLEKVSQSAISWNKEKDPSNQLIKKIKSTVDKIINLKQYESSAFIRFQQNIDRTLKRTTKNTEIKKKRSDEKRLGQKKIELAKINTENYISNKLKAKDVPEFVKSILQDEWFNVLVLSNLRYGSDSKEYLSKLKFVDLLIDSCKKNIENPITKNHILALSQKYKEGLILVAFNQVETLNKQKQLINNLIGIQKAKPAIKIQKEKLNNVKLNKEKINIETKETKYSNDLHIENPAVEKSEAEQLELVPSLIIQEPVDKKSAKSQPIKSKKPIVQDFSKVVSSLKKGSWFKFLQDDQTTIKAKFSWASPITGKLLFVDSNGLKITDKTPEELQKGLENSTITEIHSF